MSLFKISIDTFLVLVLLGCSQVSNSVLACEEKAEPKSLQFLEQKYRCKSQ